MSLPPTPGRPDGQDDAPSASDRGDDAQRLAVDRGFLNHPWVKVLLIATAVAMVSFALRETAGLTLPVFAALQEVLIPLAIGFTVAYVMTPIVDWLCRRGLSRLVATSLLYLGATALLVATLVFAVPAMVSQGKDLIQRTFSGEPLQDADRNGRWDPGESYTDLNRSGSWDPGFIIQAGAWLQARQRDLRDAVQGELDQRDLVFLARYAAATSQARAELDAILGDGPLPPSAGTRPTEIALAWPQDAPGASAERIERLAHTAPERHALAILAGRRLAELHTQMLAELRAARSGSEAGKALREAWSAPIDAAIQQAGRAAADALANDDRSGIPAAGALLSELRGADAAASRPLLKMVDDIEGASRGWVETLPGRIGEWLGSAFGSVAGVASFALSVLLVPIYAFFLTLAMPKVRIAFKTYLPTRHHQRILRIGRDIELVVSAFFRGRLIICLACAAVGVGGFYACALFGVHVPYAFLFGIAIGLVTVIPLAGLIFLAPALVMTLMEPGAGVFHVSLVLTVYTLIQVTEAVLIPVIMGREVELHPVSLIVALLLCGKLLGVLGLILAVPIFATARILAREFLWPRLRAWAEGLPDP
ncbi:hypothetical protein LBMAG53_00820 [Planctomycetota bacterium]|nr:hypothetical protein LBMAG53_00820 [Planctomycetota bacterium]